MRVAVITGASRGIGAALARRIMPECDVTIAVGRSEPLHRGSLFLSADLAHAEEVLKRLGDCEQAQGEDMWFFDVAGILPRAPGGEGFPDAARQSFAVNALTPLAIGHHLARRCESLNVVHLTSGAARRPIAAWAAYGMSKAAAAIGWRTFELEWAKARVQLVDPGAVDTGMQRELREAHDPLAAPVDQLKSADAAADDILEEVGFYR
jgi:benzil reductase ((S)-benzoin forming)